MINGVKMIPWKFLDQSVKVLTLRKHFILVKESYRDK